MHLDLPAHLLPGQLVWLARVSFTIRIHNRDARWVEAQTILFTRVTVDPTQQRTEVCFFGNSDRWYPAEEVHATEAEALAALAQHEQQEAARSAAVVAPQ